MYRILLSYLFLSFSSFALANSYVVMSSSDSTIKESIDIQDLRDIYLGNRLFWRNGERIFAAHINKESKQMKRFMKSVLSMTPRKYNKYWRRRLFSGKGHPPVEIDNDRKTIDYIRKTEGAIGIVGRRPKRASKYLYFFKASDDGHTLESI